MSFFFGSTKQKGLDEPKIFGAQKERLATNEGGRVLPVFWGTRWLGVTWVGDIFNVRTSEVRRKIGKKKQTVGHNYYASFAALVAVGKADEVAGVKFDDEWVFDGALQRGSEDYVDLTLPNRGVLRLYWGTETQGIDPLLATASGQSHSAYRGQIYVVGNNIFLGQDRTTVPNIEVLLRRSPAPSWRSTPFPGILESHNPIYVLWDWWTNKRFGCGRPESELDIPSLAAAALQLYNEGIGVSPLLTGERDLRSLLVHLFEHFDGYPTSFGAKLGVELQRELDDDGPLLTDSDLLADPSVSFQSWADTFDETRVKFLDNFLEFNDNSAKHHDLANFIATGRHKPQTLDRPWVTYQHVAQRIADAIGRASGVPRASGRVSVRESSARLMTLGAPFRLRLRDGTTLACRVEDRVEPDPDKRNIEIGFEQDMSWTNSSAHALVTVAAPAERPSFSPVAPESVRVIDAPYALSDPQDPSLIYMVSRADTFSTDFDVWKSNWSEGPFASSSERRNAALFSSFSVKAALNSDYSDDTLPVDQAVGIDFTCSSTDQSLLEGEWDMEAGLRHELLAFLSCHAVVELECVALFDVVRVAANRYTAKCVRELYDTTRTNHFAGSELWLQIRTRLVAEAWPPYSFSPTYYKFQPHFGLTDVALADLPTVQHTENARALRPLRPSNLAANGNRAGATWVTGNDVVFTWINSSRARTAYGLPINETPPTDLTAVRMELRSYDGATLYQSEDTAADESYTLTNAQLLALVGTDFSLRAYGVRDGWQSIHFEEVKVVKV
jgi:hypothetical protein